MTFWHDSKPAGAPSRNVRDDPREQNSFRQRCNRSPNSIIIALGIGLCNDFPGVMNSGVRLPSHQELTLKTRIALCCLFLLAASQVPLWAAERNIIFFITDDQSPTLGCYGDPVAISPHLDAFAKEGTLFQNAFATTASCSPSRAVILSGLHTHSNGQYGLAHSVHHFSSLDQVKPMTLPVRLAAAGYRTGHIGKLHVLPEPVYHFETYMKANPRDTWRMVEACRKFITAKDERPFFLYIGATDPHRSADELENSPLKYKPNLFGNPARADDPRTPDEQVFDPATVPVPDFLPDTPECRAELAQYYQACARIDRGFGHLLEILKAAGLESKTLVVFTSDHGIAMPGAKTTTYDPGLRVPFVVRNPYEPKKGVVSQAMISHIDVTPSLLDFAGALTPESLLSAHLSDPPPARPQQQKFYYPGKSWARILGESNPSGWDEVIASHGLHEVTMYYPMRAIRDRDYKFIWNIASPLPFPFASDLYDSATWQAQLSRGPDALYGKKTVQQYSQRPRFEFYDLRNDPLELHNLADNPDLKDRLKSYQQKMKRFQELTSDPWALKWDRE